MHFTSDKDRDVTNRYLNSLSWLNSLPGSV